MTAGYGRGYYGDKQLAKEPPRRGSGWVKLALVVGVGGAIVWFMWPRSSPADPWRGGDNPKPPPPQPPPPEGQFAQSNQFAQSSGYPPPTLPTAPQVPQFSQSRGYLPAPPVPQQPALIAQSTQQFAQSRGYPSTKEYEDAVVASAKQLKDSGAQVMLAPHLAHLAPRLDS